MKKTNNFKKNNSVKNDIKKDDKLKPLLPTLRVKKRFIKIKIRSEKPFTFKDISENLIEEMILYLGAIDFGKSGTWILRDKFDYENQEFTIKTDVKNKDKIIAILSIIKKINNTKTAFDVIKVSGTLKGLQK